MNEDKQVRDFRAMLRVENLLTALESLYDAKDSINVELFSELKARWLHHDLHSAADYHRYMANALQKVITGLGGENPESKELENDF